MLIIRMRLLIATLWAGSLWTVGYLAAPTLFVSLPDKVLAGTIAGSLFHVQAWLSIFCAITLIVLLKLGAKKMDNKALLRIVVGMLVCACVMHFGLHPFMAALRESTVATAGVMAAEAKMKFGILHGLSSSIYLIESLLAVALILKVR